MRRHSIHRAGAQPKSGNLIDALVAMADQADTSPEAADRLLRGPDLPIVASQQDLETLVREWQSGRPWIKGQGALL